MPDSYKPISKFYDLLSTCYSFGQIPRCRHAFVPEIAEAVRSNDAKQVTVCIAGVGHGDEAISAAEQGAWVTVVDISESMLAAFKQKLNRVPDEVKGRIEIIHDDFRNVPNNYAWVIANFFLNVFPEPEMPKMLDVLLDKVQLEGSLVIGDFHYDDKRNYLIKGLQKTNWYLALAVFRIFVKNAKHPIYNYQQHLTNRGWQMSKTKKFKILGVSFYASSKYTR